MWKRLGAAAVLLLFLHTGAAAQTVRFETNVGSIDMVLNPTNDPNLQPLVDNLVAYIGLGRYHFSAIHRAADAGPGTADDFVMQMGQFLAFPPAPELWTNLLTSVEHLNPVIVDATGPGGMADGQVDFTALSNTRGTVSLALSGNPNSGTSSFFVNLGNNAFLDSQGFVPFARVDDLTNVERIMSLMQLDLHEETGTPADNPTFTDVPVLENGRLVVVNDVNVIAAPADFSFCGPIATALQLANRDSASPAAANPASIAASSELASAALLAEEPLPAADSLPPADSSSIRAAAVPEPATVALGLLGVFATFMAGRRRVKR
jgi:cyclophilin family peptidyl-prolyl cis-trans isomerase